MNVQDVKAADLPVMQRMALMRRAQDELKRNPRNIDAILTVAGLLGAEGDVEGAVPWLQKALALRKKDPDILQRLMAAANDAKLYKEARKYARKLCEVEPRNAENHRNHGKLLEETGAARQAIEAYQKAERLDPGSAGTSAAIGRCHSYLGEHDLAREFFNKALKIDRINATALYGLATAQKFSSGDVDEYLANAGEAANLETEKVARSMLLFSMGKALEDTKRFDEAFEHFAEANTLRAPEDDKLDLRQFTNTLAAFRRDFLKIKEGFRSSHQPPDLHPRHAALGNHADRKHLRGPFQDNGRRRACLDGVSGQIARAGQPGRRHIQENARRPVSGIGQGRCTRLSRPGSRGRRRYATLHRQAAA